MTERNRLKVVLLVLFLVTYMRIVVLASISPTPAPSTIRSSLNSIKTIAGDGTQSSTGTGGPASAMTLNNPTGVWEDSLGVIYVNEHLGNCVRKFAYPNGIVSVVAGVCGATATYAGDNGPATQAKFCYPLALAVDSVGVVYVADFCNNRIRMVSVSSQIITTVAGTGAASSSGYGGPATSAAINYPYGLWLDSMSQLYITARVGKYVFKVTTVGIITMVAGTGSGTFSGDGSQATSAVLPAPTFLFVDSSGVVYINDDTSHRTRSVSVLGIINTVIGTGNTTYIGENIPGTSSNLNGPYGVVVDPSNGDIYTTSSDNQRLHVLTGSSGLLTTFAGTGGASEADNGAATATGVQAFGLYLDTNSRMYLAEFDYNKLRVVYSVSPTTSPTTAPSTVRSVLNNILTIAGNGVGSSTGTGGPASAMTLNHPNGIWEDSLGFIYVTELTGNCVRKFSYPNGIVSAVAGVCGATGTYAGDNGPATQAKLNGPVAVAVNDNGAVYISEYNNYRIRMVSFVGQIITTVAGTGVGGSSGYGGPATSATINGPYGLWIDSMSQIYIGSTIGKYVLKVTSVGLIQIVAGAGTSTFSGDGGQATSASFIDPICVFVDSSGIVYINDDLSYRTRRVSVSGIINTIIGTGSTTYSGENIPGTSSGLNNPYGIVVDPSNGDVYITSQSNYRVHVMTGSSGLLTTFAGTGGVSGADNGAATATGLVPFGLYLDTNSRMYLAEGDTNKLRTIYSVTPTAAPSTFSPSFQPSYSFIPSALPSVSPSVSPSMCPSMTPSLLPSGCPSFLPSIIPSVVPSENPSIVPSFNPTVLPSLKPSIVPSVTPSQLPSAVPSLDPSIVPSLLPSQLP